MSRFFKPNFPSLNRKHSRRSIFKEEFDPDRAVSLDTLGFDLGYGHGAMPTSPTPREVRRLASDHDFVIGASPNPRRLGWWAFLATHLALVAAFGAGAIFIIVAVIYTSTVSRQMLECPAWATDCTRADAWTAEHLATIQGIITLIYLIGLAALSFVGLAFCEVAIWPLLMKQPFTVRGMEAYLATCRGSILSAPVAAMAVKTLAAGFVLAAAVAVTLIPLAGPPLVGYAFTPTSQLVRFTGNYTTGGGISELYAQVDPPTSVIAGVLAEYHAWSTDPDSEPLPDYREWYVDRETLAQRGEFSAKAVKLQTTISCAPKQVQQLNRNGVWWNAFLTNMTRTNAQNPNGTRNSSAEIWVRSVPQLTVWADSFDFVSSHRTRTTLVFAALNGTIEGGASSSFISPGMSTASTLACIVDITAIDDTLTVGSNPPATSPLPVLSSLDTLQTSPSAAAGTALNELLLWFTVAPLMAGPSVDGTQPTFSNSTTTSRAVPYTSSNSSPNRNIWTTDGLETFIRLSIGALAQATVSSPPPTSPGPTTATTTLVSDTLLPSKLDPSRALLLIILPVLILATAAGVATWNARIHRTLRIPVMRLAGAGELLKSAQTGYLRQRAATDAARAYLPSELGGVEVRYGVDKDGIAGLARGVDGFEGVVGGSGGLVGEREGVRSREERRGTRFGTMGSGIV